MEPFYIFVIKRRNFRELVMDRQTTTKHDVPVMNLVPESEMQLKRSTKVDELRSSSFKKKLSLLMLNEIDMQKYFL
jgi:hypothetical protein